MKKGYAGYIILAVLIIAAGYWYFVYRPANDRAICKEDAGKYVGATEPLTQDDLYVSYENCIHSAGLSD
jgi:hypothetical protein